MPFRHVLNQVLKQKFSITFFQLSSFSLLSCFAMEDEDTATADNTTSEPGSVSLLAEVPL